MLAINGGNPIHTPSVWPPWPAPEKLSADAINEVLTSQRWSISGFCKGRESFERRFARVFADYNGVSYCVPTANGSAALVIALQALGIEPGDEIIVPGLVWVAPAVAALHVNAVPVLADIEEDTLCIAPQSVRELITDRTRAIIAVHLYCSMADMDELRQIADTHGISLIEDAAQCHGGIWRQQRAGSLGDVGVFSMHEGKPMTSGEGGAAITNRPELYEKMSQLRSSGRQYTEDPKPGDFDLEEVGDVVGMNYALSEFQAAVLCCALDQLDNQNTRRAANAEILEQHLRSLSGIDTIRRPKQVTLQTYYHFVFKINRESFSGKPLPLICKAISAELGIFTHPVYVPLNRNKLYQPDKQAYRWRNGDLLKRADPRNFELPCANSAHECCIAFHHSVLLANKQLLESIPCAVSKVQEQSSHLMG